MATIPVYQRRIQQEANAPIARFSGGDPIAAGLQNLGQAGMQAAGQMMAVEAQEAARARREADELDKAQVPNLLSNGQVYWQQREDERRQAWKVGDPDMRDTLGREFDKWVEESAKGLTTQDGKRYFLQHAAGMRARMLTDTYTFQRRATTEKLNADNAAGENNDEILVAKSWRDPAAVNAIIARRLEPLLARTDISEADKIKEAERIKSRMFLARERAYVENNPAGWLRENGFADRQGAAPAAAPAVGFDTVVQQILKTEGGYNESDGNSGAPVNFGINQRANPDIDVKNLTREGAIKIYRERYWNAIDADKLPGQLQATAMDAAVNQGVGWTKQALAEAGGDVAKFNELRRQRYRNIVAADPAQARFLNTWLARVKDPAPAAAATDPAEPSEPPTGWASQHMDPDTVYQLRNLAQSRVGQAQTQFRAEAERTIADATAMHRDGRVDPFNLSQAYFEQAYGADGARRFAEYKANQAMARAIGEFSLQPADQISAAVQSAAPAEGAGYAVGEARQQVMAQAAAQVLKRREADPVSYTMSSSPTVMSLAQRLSQTQDPGQRKALNERLIEASLAEQQRLGIQGQRILTPAMADRWQAQAMSAARPEDSANLIAALEMEYGRHFPRVFSELAREGKISGELLIIPNLPAQAAREAVSRLARVKESDLSATVPADAQRVVKQRAEEAVVDMVRTIPFMGEQSVGTITSYESMIRKMAFEQVGQGVAPNDAVERSKKMLLGHYEFQGTIRVPRGVDFRKARNGLADVLRDDLADIDVPRDYVGARTPEAARAEFTSIVRARPLWHTTDDDAGVRLFVVREDGVKMPITKGGRPLTYSWDQLQAMTDRKAAALPKTGEEFVRQLGRPPTMLDQDRLLFERLKNQTR